MNRDCLDGYHTVFKKKNRNILLKNKNVVEEYHACKYCTAYVITRTLPDGSMLNEHEYITLAKKDFLQEQHPDYQRFYKKDNWNEDLKNKKKAEQTIEDGKEWNKEFKEKIDKGQKVYGT